MDLTQTTILKNKGIIAKNMLYHILNRLWKVLWWGRLIILIIMHLLIIQIKKLLGLYNGSR